MQIRRMRPETSMSAWISALHAGMTKSDGLPALTESVPRAIFGGAHKVARSYAAMTTLAHTDGRGQGEGGLDHGEQVC